jgi:hypothetical protein
VLPNILNKTWDIKDALARRISNKELEKLDVSLNFDLMEYRGDVYRGDNFKVDGNKPNYIGKPDSALLLINRIVENEPKLKYAPYIAWNTFTALLKTDSNKAYEYGKATIATPTYDEPAYDMIIDGIQFYSDKLKIPAKIYGLGAEAYQIKINHLFYPKIVNLPKYYNEMASWYWLANDRSKAKRAERKAIKALKRKKNFSKTDLAAFKFQLKKYKRKKK